MIHGHPRLRITSYFACFKMFPCIINLVQVFNVENIIHISIRLCGKEIKIDFMLYKISMMKYSSLVRIQIVAGMKLNT